MVDDCAESEALISTGFPAWIDPPRADKIDIFFFRATVANVVFCSGGL